MILESPPKNTLAGMTGVPTMQQQLSADGRRYGTDILPTVQRSALVPYTPEQMFDLVNDVERYPEFLHWCRGAHVDSIQGNTVEATLDIGVLGFHQSFRTRNTLKRPERIGIDLVSGPFRRLRGEWRFMSAPGGGANVSLTLTFEVTLSPFGMVFAKVFEELAGSQMSAFSGRADRIYGART
jgi:ribosome-associated toxin RatA of RatAB toxin-antitoxin module